MALAQPAPATFPALIEPVVSRGGNDIALTTADDRMSFHGLADKSSLLAQGLKTLWLDMGDIAAI